LIRKGQTKDDDKAQLQPSLEILEAVSKNQPVSVGVLARLLDMPKSSVQRVGPRILDVRPAALRGGALYTAARRPTRELDNLTDKTVRLSVPDSTN
jgi:IclR family acetate operon transcriptional repressor